LAKLIPEPLAVKFRLTPIAIENDVLVVAMSDPRLASGLSDIRFVAGRKVEVRVAAPDDIETSRLVLYSDAVNQANARLSHVLDLDDNGVEFSLAGDKDLVRFCRALIKQAINKRASDIHMHPFAGGGVVPPLSRHWCWPRPYAYLRHKAAWIPPTTWCRKMVAPGCVI
jgi:type IV pilus assembly protein PilB